MTLCLLHVCSCTYRALASCDVPDNVKITARGQRGPPRDDSPVALACLQSLPCLMAYKDGLLFACWLTASSLQAGSAPPSRAAAALSLVCCLI